MSAPAPSRPILLLFWVFKTGHCCRLFDIRHASANRFLLPPIPAVFNKRHKFQKLTRWNDRRDELASVMHSYT